MHYNWQFAHPDLWTPLDTDPYPWESGQDEDAALKAAGYRPGDTLGVQDMVGATEIWRSDRGETPYPYIALVTLPGDFVATVAMATVPDLLAYYRLYGSIGVPSMLNTWQEWLERALHKLHGHTVWEPCYECDPMAMRAIARRKATP